MATFWDADGEHVITGLNGVDSTGRGINLSGIFVGSTRDAAHPTDFYGGFIGRDGSATRLHFPGFAELRCQEINDSGQFVGTWQPNSGQLVRGFVARHDLDTGQQEIVDLGTFGGNAQTIAYAINNDGTIVGGAVGGAFGDQVRALIWPAGSLTPLDLNLFVDIPDVTLLDAYRINNAGQILAEGLGPDGYSYYRLDPIVPEPGSLAIITSLIVSGSMNRPCRRGLR